MGEREDEAKLGGLSRSRFGAAATLSPLFDVLLPLFGVMGAGFLAVRSGLIDHRGLRGLVLFVFNVAIPALLVRSVAGTELPTDLNWGFLLAFYVGSLLVFAAGAAVGRFGFGVRRSEQAIFAMGAGFANLVLMGIPITLTALGPEAAIPLFAIIALHSVTFMPLVVFLIKSDGGGDGTAGPRYGAIMREVLTNPIVAGILLGTLLRVAGLGLWAPVDRSLEFLGAAAVPCALFAMGGSLAGYRLAGQMRPALGLTFLKLVAHPLIVWALAVPILGLRGLPVSVAVLLAAMPSGVNVYLFGARYEAAADVAAGTVLATSLGSLLTLSAVLSMLGA